MSSTKKPRAITETVRHRQSSTERDLEADSRRARDKAAATANIWDDLTPPISSSATEFREFAVIERAKRKALTKSVDAVKDSLEILNRTVAAISFSEKDAKAARAGALLSTRILKALIAVTVLVPSAGGAVVWAFLGARDASADAARASAVRDSGSQIERANIRKDVDAMRAEFAALVRMFANKP